MAYPIVQVSDGVTKEIIQAGHGIVPQKGSTITVHCTGSLANPLRKFWSTKDPGQQPFTFQVGLGKVIKVLFSIHKFMKYLILHFVPLRSQNKTHCGMFFIGWDEACLTMQLGEVAKILIRSDKGYGSQGFPAWGIHPNADLLFEIEILSIQ
ncbi:UNVERIFIED_CONTAM: Peptidyl-prolyl cis-trans isomerase FKBP12 [Trichonephila clavipes]